MFVLEDFLFIFVVQGIKSGTLNIMVNSVLLSSAPGWASFFLKNNLVLGTGAMAQWLRILPGGGGACL